MRKKKSSQNFRKRHPRLVGKFYIISDANGGHPARVYYADPENDTYYIQRFTTNGRDDRKQLLHSIDFDDAHEQWLVKTPIAVGFDDIKYKEEYKDFEVHKDDIETIKRYQKFDLKK